MSDVASEKKELLDSTGRAGVDVKYHWREITSNTPRGVKLQLINKYTGVAAYGILHAGDDFYWTHYALLPTFN